MFGKKKGASGVPKERPQAEPAQEHRPARETYPASPLPGHRGSGIMTPGVSRRPSASIPTPPSPQATENEGRKLVVGREISLSGEIKACEKLVVEGKVEADLTDATFLEISSSGLFVGNARVTDCDISGTFEGELTVKGRLLLRGSGLVRGKLRYNELETERGGRLIGAVDVLGADEDLPRVAAPAKAVKGKNKGSAGKAAQPADAEIPAPEAAATAKAEADRKPATAKRPRGIKGMVDTPEVPGEADAGEARG